MAALDRLDPIPPGHGENAGAVPAAETPIRPGDRWTPAGRLPARDGRPHCLRCWSYHDPEEGCNR